MKLIILNLLAILVAYSNHIHEPELHAMLFQHSLSRLIGQFLAISLTEHQIIKTQNNNVANYK